jgi:hypothetical protein
VSAGSAIFALVSDLRWTIPDVIADADLYRYLFGWIWRPGPIRVYVGLNPSTMTKLKADQTGRKWRGFAERDGFGGYIAVNGFGYRSTIAGNLVVYMGQGIDIVGPENDAAIVSALNWPGVTEVVACWGNPPAKQLNMRLDFVTALIAGSSAPVRKLCWGRTADGNPRHPLRLPYTSKLEPLVQPSESRRGR